MKNRTNYLKGTLIAAGIITTFGAPVAYAAEPFLAPEVVTSSFEENGEECASVTLNGEEVVTYRGQNESGTADERAQKLAEKLEEVLDDDKEAVEGLLPGREGSYPTIRSNGKVFLKFEPPVAVADSEEGARLAVKSSLQVINALRLAIGSTKLPDTITNFAEASATGRLANLEGLDDCFSGRASWYGPKFHGRRTSNGERFDQEGMTAAHKTLPFGTKLLVTNRATGKSCVVKVNDRGPYKDNRVIDLSKGAAKQLNMISSGVAMVDVFVLQ